mmetsp:Transcript_29945/g.45935  ORF Transcript_29945/g.45935 Transcript_29945/m.45935 type:complete len:271 (+) Transcript_29945:125-937(+)
MPSSKLKNSNRKDKGKGSVQTPTSAPVPPTSSVHDSTTSSEHAPLISENSYPIHPYQGMQVSDSHRKTVKEGKSSNLSRVSQGKGKGHVDNVGDSSVEKGKRGKGHQRKGGKGGKGGKGDKGYEKNSDTIKGSDDVKVKDEYMYTSGNTVPSESTSNPYTNMKTPPYHPSWFGDLPVPQINEPVTEQEVHVIFKDEMGGKGVIVTGGNADNNMPNKYHNRAIGLGGTVGSIAAAFLIALVALIAAKKKRNSRINEPTNNLPPNGLSLVEM